jgi:hypothetical protein
MQKCFQEQVMLQLKAHPPIQWNFMFCFIRDIKYLQGIAKVFINFICYVAHMKTHTALRSVGTSLTDVTIDN